MIPKELVILALSMPDEARNEMLFDMFAVLAGHINSVMDEDGNQIDPEANCASCDHRSKCVELREVVTEPQKFIPSALKYILGDENIEVKFKDNSNLQ
jgi:hypothetical protein